jgi:hypothetical protein
MNYYVYAHLNPNTKEIFYIGLGTGKRKYEFKAGRNKHYLNYIKKYGKPIINIIQENLTKEEACLLEIKLITEYGRKDIDPKGILLNKSLGGEGGNLGITQSLETKKKKSISMKGKKIHSEEQKEKWSNERKGKKNNWNKDHVKKDKGNKKPKGFQGKGYHPIDQYTIDGIFIKSYLNIKTVKEELNINPANIWSNLSGKTKQAGGFIWKSKKL